MVAWWTGGAWVLYFADAPTLVKELATFQAPLVAYLWIGILTFTTYALAGHMREQVCLYMCPWPRIQAALTDEHALNVTYRYDRGEPRGSVKKNAALRARGQARRRLHRLLPMRLCLPDRRRHPQRPQSRLHPVRAVHRRLRRRDGEDRPAAAADRLRHRPQHQAPAGGPAAAPPDRAPAHGALRGDHRGRRRGHALRARDAQQRRHQRHPRPQSDVRAACPTASCATAYTVRILNKSLETRSFVLTVEGLTDLDLKVVGDTVTDRPDGDRRGRPRPDPRAARAGRHLSAAAAGGLDPADLPHHRHARPGSRRAPSTTSAGHEAAMMPITAARSAETAPDPREVTGRMVLICLVAFFAVVAGGQRRHDPRRGLDLRRRRDRERLSGRARLRARDRRGRRRRTRLHWQVKATGCRPTAARRWSRSIAHDRDRPAARRPAGERAARASDRPARRPRRAARRGRAGHVPRDRPARSPGSGTLVIELSRDGSAPVPLQNRVFLR